MKSIGNAIIAGVVLCSVGCGSAPVGEGSEALDESTATLLFSDSFAEGGVMKVVEQDNGALGLVVRAPIGSEASRLAFDAGKERSLVDVYTALHPGGTPPQVLRDLSARMELQKSTAPAASKPAPVAPQIDVDKSEASFTTSFCKDFADGFAYEFILEQCKYRHNVVRVTSNPIVDGDNANLIDRSYALNDASVTATHWLDASTWQLSLPAGQSQWVEWGGVYTGAIAQLKLPTGSSGNMGITVHDNRFR